MSHHFFNKEAEQYVAGAVLHDAKRILSLGRQVGLSEDWFTLALPQAIWTGASHLVSAGLEVEPVVILDWARKRIDDYIDERDIEECVLACIEPRNSLAYMQIMKDKFEKREMSKIFFSQQEKLTSDVPAEEIRSETEFLLGGFSNKRDDEKDARAAVESIMANFKVAKDTGCCGIPSRWPAIQKMLGGYVRGEVCIVAALRKTGKTTFACNELLSLGKKDIPVGFISIEMSQEQVRERLVADDLDLNLNTFRQGMHSDMERDRFYKQAKKHCDLPIDIIDKPKTIEEITMIIRDHARIWEFVVIDYVQKIRQSRNDPKNLVERITHHSNEICNAVKQASMGCILISQLSRQTDMNGGTRDPRPEHLKGSSSLEQDASQLIMISEKFGYNHACLPVKDDMMCDANICLNRFGPTGRVEMIFRKAYNKFVETDDIPF